MTETANTGPVEIRSRWDNSVLFASTTAKTTAEAVAEAVAARVNLAGAYLVRAYLAGADLAGANLVGANLAGADLAGADLAGAFLAGANLAGASLACANLVRAYLAGADLAGADLAGAFLAGANLAGASLAGKEEKFVGIAAVQFTGHGECGRMLTAIKGTTSIRMFCGCFTGSVEELRSYIEKGNKRLQKTRTLALDTVLALLEAKNDEGGGEV